MALRARKPEAAIKRLKLFLFGSYKVGKTTAALNFPASYVIDAEKGTIHEQYRDLMEKNKSIVMNTNDVDEVTEEVRALAIEKHPYKTLVVDPVTMLEADLIEKAEREFGYGDMRIWALRDRKLKRLVNLMLRLDMNVIVTSHGKIEYGDKMTKLGTTFDAWKRWPYVFDLIVELERRGQDRVAIVRGTRLKEFQDGETFRWSYEEFCRRYPAVEQECKPITLATPEQVSELTQLLEVVKLEDGVTDKWLSKAGVESFEDMDSDTIGKCINYMKGLLPK